MGALLGLLLGTGSFLVWSALTGTDRLVARGTRSFGLTELLRRAGVEGVTPVGAALLSASVAVVTGAAMLAISGTPPVAVVFALMAAYLPIAVLRGRARRRQREFAELWPEAVDNLASAVRAGLSLSEGLVQLGERGPERCGSLS